MAKNYVKDQAGGYYEQTANGTLRGITDPQTLSGLYNGSIQASPVSQNDFKNANVTRDTNFTLPYTDPATGKQITEQQRQVSPSGQANFQQAPSSVGGRSLPTQQAPQGNLQGFMNALSAAQSMAKQQRTASFGGLMQPHQGVAPASDFNSILGNLNRAGDSFSTDVRNNALDAYQSDIDRQQEQFDAQQAELKNTKNNIQNLALDASKSGASDSVVQAILNSDSIESAIQQTSGVYAKAGQDVIQTSVRTDSAGNKYSDIILQSPDGEITTKSVFLGNDGGSGPGPDGVTPPSGDTNSPLSPTAMNVMDGVVKLDSLTPTQYKIVTDELRAMGVYENTPPSWFKEIKEEENLMSLKPQVVQEMWNAYRENLGIGGTDRDELDALIAKYPDKEKEIKEALSLGYTIDEILDRIVTQ